MEYANVWGKVEQAPPDAIFGTNQRFKNDTDANKVSLVIGAYRCEEGKPYVFPVVKKVEEEMLKENLNHEYLSMEGDPEFVPLAKKLVFGSDSKHLDRIATTQSLSGTGGLRVACEFLKQCFGDVQCVLPDPTWANHNRVFANAGFTKVTKYTYYDPKTCLLNFQGMIESLKALPKHSVVLLHAIAHNPTGVDPTHEQWQEIMKVMKEGELLPYFDSAYQGFASGDLELDAYAVRLFADNDMQFLVAQSFAKNCGMYGERIGALHWVCKDKETATKVLSQVKLVIRGMYSNPPLHGARIMSRVMGKYLDQWKSELMAVAERIKSMRTLLRNELEALETPGSWSHITSQIGMFSYTGLTADQCEALMSKHHIYLLKNGRISLSGINKNNVKRIAAAFKDVVVNVK